MSTVDTTAAVHEHEHGEEAHGLSPCSTRSVSRFQKQKCSAHIHELGLKDDARWRREPARAGLQIPMTNSKSRRLVFLAIVFSSLRLTSSFMRSVLARIVFMTLASPSATASTLFDFAANPQLAQTFLSLDDRVMGGRSVSRMVARRDHASFVGELVLAGGGFASIRSTPPQPWDLSGSDGAELVVRGDGPPYKLVLRLASAPSVSYQHDFESGNGDTDEWHTCRLVWNEFVPTYLGRVIRDAPKIDVRAVTSIGFMLSKLTDVGQTNARAKDGAFQLDVQAVRTWRKEQP